MTVFAAANGFGAHLEDDWLPANGALTIEMEHLPDGGAVIFPEATGYHSRFIRAVESDSGYT